MEDMERYGDYNETDEEPGRKSPVGIIIKILIAVVCLAVIGVVGFRIFMFNTYPEEVSGLIYTDSLREHYEKTSGNIGALTQDLGIKYDDPKEGNFFFDKVIVVPAADHIQLTVRYNTALYETIKTKYGVVIPEDADSAEIFEFRIARTKSGYIPTGDDERFPIEYVGTLGATATASSAMYRYVRVAFDGVDFGLDEGETAVGWYRLEIKLRGVDMDPYTLAVYQYGEETKEYKLGKGEVPQ